MFIVLLVFIPNVYCIYNLNNITLHPNWPKEDNTVCGKPSAFRIISGKDAGLGEFPYIASLGYNCK